MVWLKPDFNFYFNTHAQKDMAIQNNFKEDSCHTSEYGFILFGQQKTGKELLQKK